MDQKDIEEIKKIEIMKKRISLLVDDIKDTNLHERDLYFLKDYFVSKLIPGTFWG